MEPEGIMLLAIALEEDIGQLVVGELENEEEEAELLVEVGDLPAEDQAAEMGDEEDQEVAFIEDLANLQNFKPLNQ